MCINCMTFISVTNYTLLIFDVLKHFCKKKCVVLLKFFTLCYIKYQKRRMDNKGTIVCGYSTNAVRPR